MKKIKMCIKDGRAKGTHSKELLKNTKNIKNA
jgi:hypothetical protein